MTASAPPAYGGSQAPTPDAYRGVISAIFLIFFTVLGTGLGPLLVALINDYVIRSEAGLGQAMILCTVIFAAVGLPFALLGRRAYHNAIESLHR
jgi:MFS family permease